MPSDTWRVCLSEIERLVQPQSFRTWFEPIHVVRFDPNEMVFEVPDQLFADWLEENYGWVIERAVFQICGWRPDLTLVPKTTVSQKSEQVNVQSTIKPSQIELSFQINKRYRFDNFVVGDSNEFAYSAAHAVAESPGETPFNPLLIYSGVGLGKTHLLQAIGYHCHEIHPTTRIVYITAEKFISDFISAIRRRDTSHFVESYRTADVLLVDDIQFFLQTEGSQREFFHTFNTLFQNDKQIVLTSDCAPPTLKGFEPRLISRFQSGLVASIDAPDLETRMAILKHKAESRCVEIPDEVSRYIAERHATNVRELEGALTQILAFASLKKEHLTTGFVSRVLNAAGTAHNQNLSVVRIQEATAEFFGFSVDDLTSTSRKQELSQARHVGMYLCKELTPSPLKAIGLRFGRKDHTTVIHACKSVSRRIASDAGFKEIVRQLEGRLTG